MRACTNAYGIVLQDNEFVDEYVDTFVDLSMTPYRFVYDTHMAVLLSSEYILLMD